MRIGVGLWKKKQGKGLVIALVLFILMSIGLGAFIVYDKVVNKDIVSSNKKRK